MKLFSSKIKKLVQIFSVTENSSLKELFKKVPPNCLQKTFLNFDFVIRLVPS